MIMAHGLITEYGFLDHCHSDHVKVIIINVMELEPVPGARSKLAWI